MVRWIAPLALLTLTACQPSPTPKPVVVVTPAMVHVRIDSAGAIFIGDKPVTAAELEATFLEMAGATPQPQISFEPDLHANYGVVARVMAAAQRAGLNRTGVIGGT